ncbi:MAG: hypothetical protein V1872_06985 [bacterium]
MSNFIQQRAPWTSRLKLGELLLKAEIITKDELEFAIEEKEDTNKRLGECLIDLGFINKKNLLEVLSKQLGIPRIKLSNCHFDPKVFNIIPLELAQRYLILPVAFYRNMIMLVMDDPTDKITEKEIEKVTGYKTFHLIALDFSSKDIENIYKKVSQQPLKEISAIEEETELKEKNKKIGHILIQYGDITYADLKFALQESQLSHKKVGECLIELGIINRAQLSQSLSYQLGLHKIKLANFKPSPAALKTIPYDFAKNNQVLPLTIKDGVLDVAIEDPTDTTTIEKIETLTGYKVNPLIAIDQPIFASLNKYQDIILLEKNTADLRVSKEKISKITHFISQITPEERILYILFGLIFFILMVIIFTTKGSTWQSVIQNFGSVINKFRGE